LDGGFLRRAPEVWLSSRMVLIFLANPIENAAAIRKYLAAFLLSLITRGVASFV
jgi:hypothetical protein